MKRQRNTQQIKEQDKCPPNQTKEEEIGNLPDKEFRIMIVKLIQNLKIKMESAHQQQRRHRQPHRRRRRRPETQDLQQTIIQPHSESGKQNQLP